MKKILSVKRHLYLERVGMFLIVVALVAGVIVSCAGDGVEPLDHFRGHGVWGAPGTGPAGMPYIGEVVYLEDQFGNFTATVSWGVVLCNPVEKTHDGVTTLISNEDHHLMAYGLEYEDEPQWWRVTVDNQFSVTGPLTLTVAGPTGLLVPTQKEEPGGHGMPEGLDYFLGYEVIDPPSVEVVVNNLSDQFGDEQNVLVKQPKAFANPVRITHDGEVTEIVDEDTHLVTYWTLVQDPSMEQHNVLITNEFGQQQFIVTEQEEGVLFVPSEKVSWEPIEPPLSHFRCYNAGGGTMPYVGETVELEDQFGNFTATVGLGSTLCNPVEKTVNEIAAWEWVPISDPDHHLMLYILEDVAQQEWVVEVNNQFGTQELTVSGPGVLAVPTRKEGHDPPVGLDYFLCYNVTESPPINVKVDLSDQFGGGDNDFWVTETWLFANPVKITHDGDVTNIVSLDDHLVFYYASSELVSTEWHEVDVSNLFGEYTLNVMAGNETLLAVPSEKIEWSLVG